MGIYSPYEVYPSDFDEIDDELSGENAGSEDP